MREAIEGWHATIGKAILETWGLPDTLQSTVEHQDHFEVEFDGEVTLADVLVAAKLAHRGEIELARYPALRRVGIAPARGGSPMDARILASPGGFEPPLPP